MYFYVSVELDQSIKTAENLSKAFKALNVYPKFSFEKNYKNSEFSKKSLDSKSLKTHY